MAKDAKKKSAFEAFKEAYEAYLVAQKQAENIVSNVPEKRIFAAEYAVKTRAALGQDPDNLGRADNGMDADEGLIIARNHLGDRARKSFLEGLDDIISEIPEDSLSARYESYVPSEIKGNNKHNERVEAHKKYISSLNLKKEVESGEGDAAIEFGRALVASYTKKFSEKITKSLDEDKSLSPETIDVSKKLAARLLSRRGISPEMLVKERKAYFDDIKKEFTDMFENDSERAKYARANLENGIKSGIEGREIEKVDAAMQVVYDSYVPVKGD